MPVHLTVKMRRLEGDAFSKIAYEVMQCVFSIHNEFGRFFNEKIYKQELQRRFPNVQLEVPIEIHFEDFKKTFFLDALVDDGAAFEFKTVDVLVGRHRAQLLHYLLMAELSHGKLINMRSEQVQHEFINAPMRLVARTQFALQNDGWNEMSDTTIQDWFVAFLRDIGTGLDIALYEEAVTHLLGGEDQVLQEVEVLSMGTTLGLQKFRIIAPNTALKITALGETEPYEIHLRRLLNHTRLQAIQWINVTSKMVSFRTVHKQIN